MRKLIFILASSLLLHTIEAARRRNQHATAHLSKIKEIMGETYKEVNGFDIRDKHAPRELSTMANELFFNGQIAFYYINIARNVVKDSDELKQMFAKILDSGAQHSYTLQLGINSEAKKIKKIMSEIYIGYMDLIPILVDAYEFNQNKSGDNPVVDNIIQNLLDASLFTIYKIHAQVTNFKKNKEELFKEIVKSVSKIEATAKKFSNTNLQLYDELVATTRVLAASCDKIVHKLERWLIAHRNESKTSETIRIVIRNLGKLIQKLRNTRNDTKEIVSVRSKLKDFIGNSVLEFKKLAEIPEDAWPKNGYEMLRDVLLDAATIAESANAKFNLLLENKKI